MKDRAMGWGGWRTLSSRTGLPLGSVPAGRGRRPCCWRWTEPARKAVLEGRGGRAECCVFWVGGGSLRVRGGCLRLPDIQVGLGHCACRPCHACLKAAT